MGMNFPDLPAVDEVFAPPGSDLTYTWDGTAWVAGGTAAPSPPNEYVLKAGDTMGGALHLPATQPLALTESTHKQYVDTAIAAKSLYQGVWQVAANTPDLTPGVVPALHSYSWIANTVDPNLPETAPAALPGIGGQLISSSDTVIWNETTAVYELVRSPASVSGDFVEVTGDTMTGTLIAPGVEIQAAGQAASTVRMFSSASPNGGRIDFQTADGATRKGYIGYGGDNVLMLHAETGKQWQARGGFNVATGDLAVAGNTVLTGTLNVNGAGGLTCASNMSTGGNLAVTGTINPSSITKTGHIQSSSHIEAVQNVYALSFVTHAGRSVVDEIDGLRAIVETLKQEIAQLKARK